MDPNESNRDKKKFDPLTILDPFELLENAEMHFECGSFWPEMSRMVQMGRKHLK